MKQRLITAIIGLIVFVPVLFFANAVFFKACFAVISAVAAIEMLNCVGILKKWFISIPLVAFSFALPLMSSFSDTARYNLIISIMLYCISVPVLSNIKVSPEIAGFAFVGVLFCSLSFSCVAMLRENFSVLFILVYLGAWGSDTFAYLVGRCIGKTPLAPKISPHKTLEGAFGGIIADMLLFPLCGYIITLTTQLRANYFLLAFLGFVCAVISQIGDLVMSAIKRSYNIKDFGNVFPGHGGVLDRFDSTLTVAPVLYFILLNFEIFYI